MNDSKNFVESIGGYVLDVIAKLRNRPFVPHSLTKLHNIKLCRDLTGATTAVEVGSYRGVTARRLSYLFPRVVTIEIDPALHAIAKAQCAGRKNIELLLGDGAVLLPEIAAGNDDMLIFLDGHFSGGTTGHGDEPEPVLKEIDLLRENLARVRAVVVDDFRLFGVEPGWPRKSEVIRKLEDTFEGPDWQLTVQYDQFLAVRNPKAGR